MSNSNQDAIDKIVGALKHQEAYLVGYGRQLHETFPPNKMDHKVFEAITVPVVLPVAMMLLGLGSAMVAGMSAPKPREAPAEGTPT
jgi:hypothetical protein